MKSKKAPVERTGHAPATTEERVQVCMRLMRRLKWRRGVTDKNIAAHWGITPEAIRHYSGEASRRLKAEMTDPDSTAATVCVALERVIREAAEKGMYGHRSIIEAAKTWAQIAGAGAPTRLEIGALSSMTEEQLNSRRKELMARLSADDAIAELPPTEDQLITVYAEKAANDSKFLAKYNGPDTIGGAAADAAAMRAEIGVEEEAKEARRVLRRRENVLLEELPDNLLTDPTLPLPGFKG